MNLVPCRVIGTQTANGRLELFTTEGVSLLGTTLRVDNRTSRIAFDLPRVEFINRKCSHGPTHLCALGVGHHAARIAKVGRLLGLRVDAVVSTLSRDQRDLPIREDRVHFQSPAQGRDIPAQGGEVEVFFMLDAGDVRLGDAELLSDVLLGDAPLRAELRQRERVPHGPLVGRDPGAADWIGLGLCCKFSKWSCSSHGNSPSVFNVSRCSS
jgi:hypothetical protein